MIVCDKTCLRQYRLISDSFEMPVALSALPKALSKAMPKALPTLQVIVQ